MHPSDLISHSFLITVFQAHTYYVCISLPASCCLMKNKIATAPSINRDIMPWEQTIEIGSMFIFLSI